MSNQLEEKVIRVGSRKSELALIQTKHVIGRLQKLYPNKKFEIHTMSTIGDRVLNISLPKIGEKSLFTRDLEDALLNGGVDFVVHSLKDLPTALPLGMAVGAVLEREDARDALVLRENYKDYTIDTLPKGCVIGTSSLRRTAQIRRRYKNLIVCDIRGNLNTRLAKLDAPDSKFAGIILAQAGLVRMGWEKRISQTLEPADILYAVGQGALAVECRANDRDILDMLQKLMCLPTACRILAERSFLKTLGGGCSAPVAVQSQLQGNVPNSMNGNNTGEAAGLKLKGAVWSLDGGIEILEELSCSLNVSTTNKRALTTNGGNQDNGSGNDVENGNGNVETTPPPNKRARSSPTTSTQRQSPPVINDDADVDQLSSVFDVNELIEKHIDLAKKCPVVGVSNSNDNNNIGGGDADCIENDNHCPLQIDVGQDVMGQCPFVSNEAKVTYAHLGKCPITKETPVDEIDHSALMPSTSSKCPFSTLHKQHNDLTTLANNNNSTAHGKCPFLQKTVKMFDYGDEEKPVPQKLTPVLIEDVDNLFCGLYQHACYNREIYAKSDKLGQQLAQELINKGALEIMKCAQAEIHSKIL